MRATSGIAYVLSSGLTQLACRVLRDDVGARLRQDRDRPRRELALRRGRSRTHSAKGWTAFPSDHAARGSRSRSQTLPTARWREGVRRRRVSRRVAGRRASRLGPIRRVGRKHAHPGGRDRTERWLEPDGAAIRRWPQGRPPGPRPERERKLSRADRSNSTPPSTSSASISCVPNNDRQQSPCRPKRRATSR